MPINLAVIMDPIAAINFKKDSTLAILLAAQQRQWTLYYIETKDLFLKEESTWAQARKLRVFNDEKRWYELGAAQTFKLEQFQVVLMRKDPPFDMEYIFTTYLLENAEMRGAFVVNKPQSLRDANEKLFISWFPQCCPKTLVTSNIKLIREFLQEQEEIVLKPLGSMGGSSVFRINKKDSNANVIMETLTNYNQRFVMAQQFIPEVLKTGDKRVIMIDGKPIPYALARIPAKGDFRGNLAVGAQGKGMELTERDYWICDQVGDTLRKKGLLFVGLDIIGDYLTEINVTSPTGIRQLDEYYKISIGVKLLDSIEHKLKIKK